MAKFIRIREWSKYQHYKHRNPPWIKLHRELLTSTTWACADDASRTLAIACMLLAAVNDNKIPADGGYIRRVAYLNSDPDFTLLEKTQFIEFIDDNGLLVIDASAMLADASKMRTNHASETETETEKSKRQKKPSSRCASTDSEIFPKAYQQYPRHEAKRAANKSWYTAVVRTATEQKQTFAEIEDFIYQRVMTYAACCKRVGKEKKFIPHMATWLNQDRFMDDPSEWAVMEKKNGNGNYQSTGGKRDASNVEALVLSGLGARVQYVHADSGTAVQDRTDDPNRKQKTTVPGD